MFMNPGSARRTYPLFSCQHVQIVTATARGVDFKLLLLQVSSAQAQNPIVYEAVSNP